jgi:hypothetical protein
MVTVVGVCLVLGVIQILSRWASEEQKAEAEFDQMRRIDLRDGDQLIRDLAAIRSKLGRFPKDEAELVDLRGKPMPIMHSKGDVTFPLTYTTDDSDKTYKLVYRWSSGVSTYKYNETD